MADDLALVGFLKILAKRYRGRVAGLNLHDPNVCTSAFDWREALTDRPPPVDRFRYQLKLKHDGQSFTVRSNDRFVAVRARGKFGSPVPFSINRPDRIVMPLPRVTKLAAWKNWRVYIDTNAGAPPVMKRPDVLRAIENLALGHDESLHVYGNGLTVYIRPKSAQRVADVVAGAATLANHLPSTERLPEFGDLPIEFRALVGLIDKWAKSDDQERADGLARASRERHESLVRQLAPHFAAINAYLDRFRGGAVSDSAAALGTLAECATEAQLLLAKRRGRPAVPNPYQPSARQVSRSSSSSRRVKKTHDRQR
jgi:hypothetical protein